MQGKHLTYEEFELYLNTGDVSEEYLCKVESISQHLGECKQCQSMLEKVLLMDSVCEEDTLVYGMDLLKKEADIRRELFAEKLKKAEEDKRIRMVAETMRRGQPEQRNYSSGGNLPGQESFANMANSNNVQRKYLLLADEEPIEKQEDIVSIENKPAQKKQKRRCKPVWIGVGVLLAVILVIVIALILI